MIREVLKDLFCVAALFGILYGGLFIGYAVQ